MHIGEGEAAFELDTSEMPLVVVRYPRAGVVDGFDALFEEYARLSKAHSQIAYLIDLRASDPAWMGAAARKRAAECYARHVDVLGPSTVCEARIVANDVVRGILTAFEWLKGDSAWPCETFENETQARAWIEEHLAQGAPASP